MFFQKHKKVILFYSLLSLLCAASLLFVYQNAAFYDRTIAKVVATDRIESEKVTDMHGNEDRQFTQKLVAGILNGEEKGQQIELLNDYSYSGAYDDEFRVGHELFISIDRASVDKEALTGEITDIKRDKYLVMMIWVFVFTLVIVGKKQGFFSVISLAVNALLLSFALDIYVRFPSISLVLICAIAAIFSRRFLYV